jgi:uncharacterized protein YjbI with pentapeptide repeats
MLTLRNVNLPRADLRDAVLYDVDLEQADLRGADLRGTRFEDASLAGANLSGARIDTSTELARANVAGCIGCPPHADESPDEARRRR